MRSRGRGHFGELPQRGGVGGPIAFIQDGDIISIDIDKCQINFKVSEEEMAKRKENWTPLEPKVKTGYLRRYSKMVSSAIQGAVMLDD